MNDVNPLPTVPAPLCLLLQPLPLVPLQFVLQRVMESTVRSRPDLFDRLDDHARKIFLIDPTDLPFVFRLAPSADCPSITPRRREDAGEWDARIAGPLGALIGMTHGVYDGDALFFSGNIVIEGDTEAVLALRNSIDNAEIDLVAEAAAVIGPAGDIVERAARSLSPLVFRLTGLALTRADRC